MTKDGCVLPHGGASVKLLNRFALSPNRCFPIHVVMRAVRSGSFRAARGVGWAECPNRAVRHRRRSIVAIAGGFWHRWRARRLPAAGVFGCGCSSGVEHDLAKVGVEGSNPFARSSLSKMSMT